MTPTLQRRSRSTSALAGAALTAVLALGVSACSTSAASDDASGPTASSTTATGTSGQTLTVSKAADLDPQGEKVTVTGKAYLPTKGIYVALCIKPAAGEIPSPCGGGADTSGTTGSSVWVSSNPPPYGKKIAKPYGVGGTFTVTLDVGPTIGDIDCRTTQCAIVTRNDHTRTSDRSQDVLIPVTFTASAKDNS